MEDQDQMLVLHQAEPEELVHTILIVRMLFLLVELLETEVEMVM